MTKITIEKGQLHLSNTVIKRKFECDIKIRLRDLYFRLYLCIYEIISNIFHHFFPEYTLQVYPSKRYNVGRGGEVGSRDNKP